MASESSPKRTKMIMLGITVLVIGLVAAVVLWLAGGSRRTDAVANLARAPIGCDTTLDFSVPGEYLVFVESKGTFADVRGDCGASGDFEVGASRPQIDITVLDPDGKQLDLADRSNVVTYSTPDFVGRSVLAIDVIEAGDHVMRVEAGDDDSFAVAVGRDPNSGVALLRGAAVALGLLGLVLGLLLAFVAGRKRQPAGPGWTPAQPQGQWPQHQQPGQPPYQQPGQPPYNQPGQPPYNQPAQPSYGQPGMPGAQSPFGQSGQQPQQGPAQQPGQPPYYAQGAPPVYGGYGQPGQYGQQASASAPTDAGRPGGMPQPPPPTGRSQHADPRSFAPTVPDANPFAPPAGHPIGGVAAIPGQPGQTGAGKGDGEMGWPGDIDDSPTPPRGTEITPRDADPAPTSDVDRWNTSEQTPPD